MYNIVKMFNIKVLQKLYLTIYSKILCFNYENLLKSVRVKKSIFLKE